MIIIMIVCKFLSPVIQQLSVCRLDPVKSVQCVIVVSLKFAQLDTKFQVGRVGSYSRPEDFLEVKDALDVIDVLLPGQVAGLAVFFRHFAPGGVEGRRDEAGE